MSPGTVLAAVLVGVVVGTTGRYILPLDHQVSRRATLLCGLLGAGIGLVVGVSFFANPELVVIVQIAAALALVWGYAWLHTRPNLHSSR